MLKGSQMKKYLKHISQITFILVILDVEFVICLFKTLSCALLLAEHPQLNFHVELQ